MDYNDDDHDDDEAIANKTTTMARDWRSGPFAAITLIYTIHTRKHVFVNDETK